MVAVRSAGALYYIYSDHLGSVVGMTNATGGIIANSLTRYDPFGNYRTWPGSNVNPLISDRGFTGHVHDNTGPYPTQNEGLIYMNARYYLPEVGRFISADTIVPDPANPQGHNRYSYVLNSPTNLADPSGHCGGDPTNNNPFGETGLHLDCTLENFDAMPIATRLEWMKQFMSQFGAEGWFTNIVGIIQGFVDNGLAASGSWLSVVDAAILQGIQDGFASSTTGRELGVTGNAASNNPGAAYWAVFFDELLLKETPNEALLIEQWGDAEKQSTKHGEEVAAKRGVSPNRRETFFLVTGNVYRDAATNGGLGLWAAGAALVVDGNPFVVFQAYQAGKWFNDPRSVDPVFNRSPVYWYSSAIWTVGIWPFN